MKKIIVILTILAFTASLGACKYRPRPVDNQPPPQTNYNDPAPQPDPQPAPPTFRRQGTVTAIGNAAIKGQGAQAMLMAKRGAKTEAMRNLWETVGGLQISSETRVEDFVTQSDRVMSQARGYLQGAQVVYNKETEPGIYECKVQLDLADFWAFIDSNR